MKINQPKRISCATVTITSQHVPDVKLCRFFKEQSHVEAFNKGRYKFGNLNKYRNTELGQISDQTESESSNFGSDGSQYGSFSSGSYYALCCTELNRNTKIDELAEKFGDDGKPAICVPIKDNICLTRDILMAWARSIDKFRIAYFQWHKVVYNKNEFGVNLPLEDNDDLHCYQKPKCHRTHRLQRIRKTILTPPQPDEPEIIDLGGDIDSIYEFNSINPIAMQDYNSRLSTGDYKILEPKINNFEIEQEWRLIFFSPDGYNCRSGKPFKALNDEDYFLISPPDP